MNIKTIFYADETGLCWKEIPNRTYVSKNEKIAFGLKVSINHVIFLLCSNALGDCMTKPLLIYRSLNPHELKDK